MRVAIFDKDSCKPNDCAVSPNKPCIKYCPTNRTGMETIILGKDGFPRLNQLSCTGCAICVKKCPFHCFKIINIPERLESEIIHKYRPDGFTLFRLLIPSENSVLGVIGQNGIGKSTALKILSNNIMLNLGKFGDQTPSWEEVIDHFKGTILQKYFTSLSQNQFKIVHKPQEMTSIPKFVKGTVEDVLSKITDLNEFNSILEELSLSKLLNREIKNLSGGELQRVAIAAAVLQRGDCYLIDEPSSYLDISQRLKMAGLIRNLSQETRRVVVIEHDLAILDFMSDQICLLYGEPSAYGIISQVHGVRVGINTYLNGYIRDENMRFRDEPIKFHDRPPSSSMFQDSKVLFEYNDMEKTLGDFNLRISGGEIHKGEVVGILGPNGIGKTTFINLIAGQLKPDNESGNIEKLKISLKPQYIEYNPDQEVYAVINKIKSTPEFDTQYKKRILNGFKLDELEDRSIGDLSGGELQRLAIADCLTNDAEIFLIDEPSAFLDVEMRLTMAVIIRKSIENIKKAAFVVEHDIVTQDFISDSLLVFDGDPGFKGYCGPPQDLRDGMNEFLKIMNITFRRDLSTGRPRVNKAGSNLDKYQRRIGEYYYIPIKDEE